MNRDLSIIFMDSDDALPPGSFPRKHHLVGRKFGSFLVIARAEAGAWLCQCDCGNQRRVGGVKLLSGEHASCGCSRLKDKEARVEKYRGGSANPLDLRIDALKEVLHYSLETGVFTWLVSTARRIKPGDIAGKTNGLGYWSINLGGFRYNAHHLAWFYVHGVWPADKLDHINLDRSDNRIDNLREASAALNQQNTRISKSNTSGFKGVSKRRSSKRWHAEIMVNKKPIRLGWFDTPEQASEAYLAAKRQLHAFYVEGQGVRRDGL